MMRLTITVQGGRLEFDKSGVRRALRAAGAEVASLARSLIRNSEGGGKLYRGHRASAPGQPPASLTGTLAQSISVKPFKNGEGVSIRDAVYYALFLEAGAQGGGGNTRNLLAVGRRRGKARMRRSDKMQSTRVLAPRPFLSLALEQREGSISRRLETSINDGVKFVREKAPRKAGVR